MPKTKEKSQMGRKPKNETTQAVASTATMTPAEYLASVNREQLDVEIAKAEEEARKANGLVRSLRNLRRMVAWRDGESPLKKALAARGQGKNRADDDSQWEDREAILLDLGRQGPSTSLEIATRTLIPLPRAKDVLKEMLTAGEVAVADGRYHVTDD